MQIITARVVILAASLAAAGVCPAYAQRAAPRAPAGGLFGATRSDAGGRDKLNFTFHLAEGFDSALPPQLNARVARGLDSGGLSTVLEASSDYHRSGRRLQLTGNASTAFKHYLSVDRFEPVSHSVFLGADVRVPKGSLKLEQGAAYSPSYLYQLFPTDTSAPLAGAIPTNPEYQIAETDSYSYRTNAALSFGSAAATRVTTSGSLNRTDFAQQTASTRDLDTAEAGMTIVHNAGPSRRVSAGYDFRVGEFGSGGRTEEHSVTLGLAYSPALSRTRRATFSVNLTPSRIDLPASALEGVTTDAVDQTLFRFSGEVVAEFPFRPNWRTAARYRRSLEYLSVVNQPMLADGARVELSGLLSRRVDVSASAGYVTAASALAPSIPPLETYTGQVAVRYAMKRSVALSLEYLYYYYDLAGQALFSPGLPNVFRQQGVRIGAVLFLETLGR